MNGQGEYFVFVRMSTGELARHAVDRVEWARLERGARYTLPVETR